MFFFTPSTFLLQYIMYMYVDHHKMYEMHTANMILRESR